MWGQGFSGMAGCRVEGSWLEAYEVSFGLKVYLGFRLLGFRVWGI